MILLDTNVVSELMRSTPNPTVIAWVDAHDRADLRLCAPVLSELLLGLEMKPAGRGRDALRAALDVILGSSIGMDIVPFDAASAAAYARIVSARTRVGRPIAVIDAQIAAIAAVTGAAVASRDVDLTGTGVPLHDPFDARKN